MPLKTNQQPTSPDITSISNKLHSQTKWRTITKLSSDHLPIITAIKLKTTVHLPNTLKTYTNYKKANWENFTKEIEEEIAKHNTPTNIHIANKILINAILTSDKHNIPKGKIQTKHTPLPENIRVKIEERNHTRQRNSKDLTYTLNSEIDTHTTSQELPLERKT